MRITAIALMLLTIAVCAYAASDYYTTTEQMQLPNPREAIYCQTTSSGWGAFNASSAFGSEMADDIPASYSGTQVDEVTLYVAQWGGGWSNPVGMVVNFYNTSCPPGQNPDNAFNVAWGDCASALVYAGSWYVYSVVVPLNSVVTIGASTSLGGYADINWGQNPPYTGLVYCDTITGCPGYWDGDYWGAPRWTRFSGYFGYDADVAYCIGYTGGTATEESSWGHVKSLYR